MQLKQTFQVKHLVEVLTDTLNVTEVKPFTHTPLSDASAPNDFENIVTIGEIAQDKQYLLLSQCFQSNPIVQHSLIQVSVFLFICFKSCLLPNCCLLDRINHFPHTDTL